MENTRRGGFVTRREEVDDVALGVSGAFPDWLDGTFVSNGPGQFEVGDTRLEHWFDALAMTRRVRVEDGTVRYTNRFVRNEDFRTARDERRVRRSLPGTFADGSVVTRIYRALTGGFQDNPSIGVVRLDGTLYAVTESPLGFEHSYLRELDFEGCFDSSFSSASGDRCEISAGATIRTCADPCPGFSCSYCLPLSVGASETYPMPDLS